jgi:hypothetical protein
MSRSSLVSLRAVYRDCPRRSRHCSVTVTMGFASGEPHTAITASPMLRVSKRLTANVFHEPEVEAGTSAAMPPTPKLPASYSGESTSSTITASSPKISADRAPSTSHARGSGLEF